MKFVYDSYALIEILQGNSNYKQFASIENAVITSHVLAEMYYKILREHGEKRADEKFKDYKKLVIEVSDDVLKSAMKFRLEFGKKYKERKMVSYTDSILYTLAANLKIKFLTGDSAFKGLENVEYVK